VFVGATPAFAHFPPSAMRGFTSWKWPLRTERETRLELVTALRSCTFSP
jgi:hypothetical protein